MPPIQLLLTRRLLLAKQLLTETTLPITEVAFASGFSSLRRFNDAFNRRYGMPPTRLRRKATEDAAAIVESQTSTLQLSYRPPYDWKGVLAFLAARALKGVEHVTDSSYARTVQLGEATGWIRVTQSTKKHALMVEFTHSLTPVLPALLSRVRALFDLNARPDLIAKHLRRDARLAAAVKANPGLRVPGAFNGFEMGVRAILGQQVTVKAATTIAGRFVEAFGEPIVTPFAELNRLTPAPARVAAASVDDIARHGIVAARCRSIIALARGAGIGRAVPRRRRASQSRRLHQAAGRVAGHRPVDGALHRHARPALARRVPEGRHRRAQQPRRRHGERGRGVVTTLAAVAELRGHARLAHGQAALTRAHTRKLRGSHSHGGNDIGDQEKRLTAIRQRPGRVLHRDGAHRSPFSGARSGARRRRERHVRARRPDRMAHAPAGPDAHRDRRRRARPALGRPDRGDSAGRRDLVRAR